MELMPTIAILLQTDNLNMLSFSKIHLLTLQRPRLQTELARSVQEAAVITININNIIIITSKIQEA